MNDYYWQLTEEEAEAFDKAFTRQNRPTIPIRPCPMKEKPMTDVVTPIVHLNGTSKQELIDQRLAVLDALRKAGEALRNAAPNARDYYPEPGRLTRAEAQHRRRLETLKLLVKQVEAEVTLIDREGE